MVFFGEVSRLASLPRDLSEQESHLPSELQSSNTPLTTTARFGGFDHSFKEHPVLESLFVFALANGLGNLVISQHQNFFQNITLQHLAKNNHPLRTTRFA